jgi:serine/threonine protein kinase
MLINFSDLSNVANYKDRGNIWSLGIVLLELICGVMPYQIYLDKILNGGLFDCDLIERLNIIKNVDVVLLIDNCFCAIEKHLHHYSFFTTNFIRICLNKFETRPSYDVLKNMLNEEYEHFFEDPKYLCNEIAKELEYVSTHLKG